MLSELCVRRPVFATMLVMSLVVLGIFSFRDLGVDLFPDADPVMALMVSSDAMSLRTLTELADKQVSRSIQTVNGVGQVTIAGSRGREIHIVVDIEKLNSYGLSLTEVRDAVIAENVEIPGGAVEQGKRQLLLRTMGRIDASADFNNVVCRSNNGPPSRAPDV